MATFTRALIIWETMPSVQESRRGQSTRTRDHRGRVLLASAPDSGRSDRGVAQSLSPQEDP